MINTFGIDSMTQDVNGNIYVSLTEKVTNVNYVMLWNGETWTEIGGPTAENRLQGSYISKIRYVDGVLYAGVFNPPALENGFFRFISNTWTPKGILNASVFDFDIDSAGTVYIAANNAIYKSNGDVWNDITPEVGFYTKIAVDSSNRVYTAKMYGAADGFRVYDNNLWSTLPDSPIESDDVVKMCVYGNKLYIAGWSNVTDEMIVAVYNGSTWSQLAEITESFPNVAGKDISSLYADDKGVYITYKDLASGSVLKWNGQQWLSIGDNLQSPNGFNNSGHFNEFLRNPQGYLLGAGSMHDIDGVVAGNIARYLSLEAAMLLPPTIWTGLPFPNNLVHQITAMTKLGTDIYIGVSDFAQPSAPILNQNSFIYKWNGTAWSEIGGIGNRLNNINDPGSMSIIMSLVWNNGKLYAATYSDGSYVWENDIWSKIPLSLGDGRIAVDINDPDIIYHSGQTIDWYNNGVYEEMPRAPSGTGGLIAITANGNVYLTGYEFTNDVDMLEDYIYVDDGIFMWDGTEYHALGDGVSTPLPEWNDALELAAYENKLYVLGYIPTTNKLAVALWDGKEWNLLGNLEEQFPDIASNKTDLQQFTPVGRKALYADSTGVYISGFGSTIGRTLRWDGMVWTDIGSPMLNNGENGYYPYPDKNPGIGRFHNFVIVNNRIYGAGLITYIQDDDCGNIAYRELATTAVNNTNWFGRKSVPPGYNSNGYTCTSMNNDIIYVTVHDDTYFTTPYRDYVYKVGDHEAWVKLGSNDVPFGNISKMKWHNDILYVIGTHHTPAKCENGVWSLLPQMPGPSGVNSNSFLEIDSLGRIWVSTYENVWMLDGGTWSSELIFPNQHLTGVMDSNDLLYIHVRDNTGATVPNIVSFDGTTVIDLPDIVDTDISDTYQFIIHNNRLYINATDAANIQPKVMEWDGSEWSQIGDIVTDLPTLSGYGINALHVDQYGVYANIAINDVGGGSKIIKWTGTEWIVIASVLTAYNEPFGQVINMYRKSNGRLFISGYFNSINGELSKDIASYAVDETLPQTPRLLLDGGAGNNGIGFIENNAFSGLQNSVELKSVTSFGGFGTPNENVFFVTATAGYSNTWFVAKYENGVWANIANDNFAKGADGNFNSGVFCQAMYNGSLYIGGTFNFIDPKRIAKWNGSGWDNVIFKSSGFVVNNPQALAMASDEVRNRLYIGGAFAYSVAPDGYCNFIGYYNDADPENNWIGLNQGLNGNVNTITLDTAGNVYCGGTFNSTAGDNIPLNKVGKWNIFTDAWEPLSSGMNDAVVCSTKGSGNDIFFGGYFTMAGGVAANRIAKWNGVYFVPLGSGLDGPPRSMVWDDVNNCLYVAGNFYSIDGVVYEGLAKWDGSAWSKVLPNQINFTDSLAIYLCK